MYLFVIDIGNTAIKFGIFDNCYLKSVYQFIYKNNIDNQLETEIKYFETKNGLNKKNCTAVVISSVVPKLNNKFNKIIKDLLGQFPVLVNHKNANIKIHYKNPEQLGTDRIVNAIACYELFGGPSIIIDFGTTTTFDCIDKNGEFLGGIIIPGIDMSLKTLNKFTAKLPYIPVSTAITDIPQDIIGHSTDECIINGIQLGYTGMVNNIIVTLLKKMGSKTKVIATGGIMNTLFINQKQNKSTYLFGMNKIDNFVPHLTLYGLKYFYFRRKNTNKKNFFKGLDKN